MKKYLIVLLAVALLGCGGGDDGSGFNFGDGKGVQAVSGSLAAFQAFDGFLYVLADDILKVFDLAGSSPQLVAEIVINANPETIYRYGDHLLLGTRNGMLIYDITERTNPVYKSQINHQTACDPVIAKNGIAYVTIRGGVGCNWLFPANRLIVIDISDLENPQEIRQIEMLSPRGLTISEGRLFVGEGANGLKQFDLADPTNPIYETIYGQVPANDLIALGNQLIITGPDGILQYNHVDGQLQLLSTIQ